MSNRLNFYLIAGVLGCIVLACASAGAQETAPTAPAPRLVAPQLIAPPEIENNSLQRIEPRPPLDGTLGRPPSKAEMLHEDKLLKPDPLLFMPVAMSAGVIVAGGRTITIAGVEPVSEEQMCGGSVGLQWPCGKIARTAFRGFLRGRAVRCDFPDGEVPQAVSVTCRLGNRDVGEWLVANGWAKPTGDLYQDQQKKAADSRKGINGDAPPTLPAMLRNEPPVAASDSPTISSSNISILPSGTDTEDDVATPETTDPSLPPAAAPTDPLPAPSSPQPAQ